MGHVRSPRRPRNTFPAFASWDAFSAHRSKNEGPPRHLLKEAFEGKAEAQHRLARFYEEGTGVDPDRATALMWFEKSAGAGHLGSQLRLGQLLLEQESGMTNRCRGLFFMLKAAHRGSEEACRFLANARMDGDFLPQSDFLAMKWYRLAALRGCMSSMMGLAYCYMNGRGVDLDLVKAHALLAAATYGSGSASQVRIHQQTILDEPTLREVEQLAREILHLGVGAVDA